jgi:uncharacterized membrane protein
MSLYSSPNFLNFIELILINTRKNMSVCRSSIIIALVVSLGGCATSVPLQRSQVDAINRDLPPAGVEQTLGKATPTAKFEFTANGNPFFVRHYLLQTGTQQTTTTVCTTYCFPVPVSTPITAQYLVVQRLPSRDLHAWGTIEELSKDTEPSVSLIMPELKARLKVALAEKK